MPDLLRKASNLVLPIIAILFLITVHVYAGRASTARADLSYATVTTSTTTTVGEGGSATTSSSLPASTTSTTTGGFIGTTSTSSTVVTVSSDECGDADDSGSILASDALITLKAAIGLTSCDLCKCDVDDSGGILASDALLVLKKAIGLVPSLNCPVCSTTTTTTTTTTTLATSWAEVMTVFADNSCTNAGCHGNGSAGGGLGDMDNSSAGYAALVGATADCALVLVVAGDDASSFLMNKLDATSPLCGSRMPLGATMSETDRDAIRSWINGGALE
ncbi:MAG: hypothetical protein VCA74_07065 [Deltaproteobacteria bacterium]